MKLARRHKVKREKDASSSSSKLNQVNEEHELVYYIHDRVELLHQVFSVLKGRELRAMAPDSVRNLSIDDLQELCLEELLGISSKRLCAILDGAEPPTDTESSSDSSLNQNKQHEGFETISLDSISSDEVDLESHHSSNKNKKQKRKCRRREARDRARQEGAEIKNNEKEGQSRAAERAGMTVLELLELQARARAIRAQLALEQNNKNNDNATVSNSDVVKVDDPDDDDVEIKEEPAEIVELSSDDEKKPNVTELQQTVNNTNSSQNGENRQTERRNDLTIIVPKVQNRKIRLNRNKVTVSISSANENAEKCNINPKPQTSSQVASNHSQNSTNINNAGDKNKRSIEQKVKVTEKTVNDKEKKKKRKKLTRNYRKKEREGSDHDEIMLQLSDSEKMDLLEDFSGKNYDKLSSSETSSSEESDSGSDEQETNKKVVFEKEAVPEEKNLQEKVATINKVIEKVNKNSNVKDIVIIQKEAPKEETANQNTHSSKKYDELMPGDDEVPQNTDNINKTTGNKIVKVDTPDKIISIACTDDIPLKEDLGNERKIETEDIPVQQTTITAQEDKESLDKHATNNVESTKNINAGDTPSESKLSDGKSVDHKSPRGNGVDVTSPRGKPIDDKIPNPVDATAPPLEGKSVDNKPVSGKSHDKSKDLSEGELSDYSMEVEMIDAHSEVVCISDEEKNKKSHKKKKIKKKDRKSKKDMSDFHKASDQNFYKDTKVNSVDGCSPDRSSVYVDSGNDVLEISDDSSCYEVEGVSVLSKEPTSEEIEALSAKIDHELEREEVITEKQIREHERIQTENVEETQDLENVSWKSRYLVSKKVKNVLRTSNILNALRKKNKELKKKLEEARSAKPVNVEEIKVNNVILEEGSIEHYNMLQGSTKYFHPMPEVAAGVENNDNLTINNETERASEDLNREMKRDAKQLLKMYKRLLKYNNMEKKPKDPNRMKKKKSKKSKNHQ